jgi:transposase
MNSELWAEVRRLAAIEKLSKSAIAARLRIDRKTVRRALASQQTPGPRIAGPKPSKLDAFKSYLQNRLKEYPELSAAKLLIELKRMGYPGGYTQLKEYLATLRPKANETYLRIETLPGEQAQVDWANCGAIRVGSALRKLSAFVMVLAYSRMLYLEFTLSQCLEDFLAAHLNAFRFFGGIPKKILYDNLKTVVLARVGRDIRFNPKFVDFAGYHLFEPIPCAPGKGNEKGKVENGIKYIRSSCLAGYAITSWPDLQAYARSWRDDTANVRIHGTTRQRPIDRFEAERSLLQALPPKDYDVSIIRSLKANNQAFVLFDVNAYSVPWELSSKPFTLKATAHEINIFDRDRLVASHTRSYEKHLYFEKPEHRRGLLASRKAAVAAKAHEEFLALGDLAQNYLQGLLHSELHLPHHLQKIMDMVGLYGKTEVLQALDHALKFNAFGAPYIQNIITQQRARRGLAEPRPIQIAKKPQWTQLSVEDQDLSLYDQLFPQDSQA